MATERITIIVDEKGSVVVKKRIKDVGDEFANTGVKVNKTTQAFSGLKTAFAGLAGAISLGALVGLADTFTNIQNRMAIVTSSTDELNSAMAATYDIAQSTYTAWEGIATIYARTAQASTTLGLSQAQLINFTNQLAQATALSGASAESASAALIQLSQGMASGTLRGQELNSVLEQLPYVSNAIAAGLGITIGKLRELAQDGQITPQAIITAFNKMATSIEADFRKMTPTISMGLQTIQNGFIKLMGTVQNSTGVFGAIGYALVLVGNNMGVVAAAISPLVIGLAALAARAVILAGAQGFGALITAMVALVRGLQAATVAALALTASPLVLWATGAVVAVAALTYGIYGMINGFDEADKKIAAFVDTAKKKIAEVSDAALKAALSTDALKQSLEGLKSGGGSALKVNGKEAAKDIENAGKKAGKEMGGGVEDGGRKAGYGFKTAIEAANDNGAAKLKAGVQEGGSTAAAAITAAGNVMAAKFEGTGRNIYDLWNNWGDAFIGSFNKSIGDLVVAFQNAQTRLLKEQALLTKEQAENMRLQNEYLRRGKSLPGQGGSGSGSDSSGTSGGTYIEDRWNLYKGKKKTESDNRTGYTSRDEAIKDATNGRPLTIINRLEPATMLGAMSSREGDDVIYNSIAANPDRFRKALGLGR